MALTIVALPTSAQTPGQAHGEFIPRRGPDGTAMRGPHDTLQSSNWSGYAVPSYATGQKYTSASGTWIVPTVANTSAGYSSSWVGIGGFCLNTSCTRTDHSLIQLGTEQDVDVSGNASYYAWYEMLPNPEIKITSFTVHPGDMITASLKLQPAAQKLNGKNTGSKTAQSWFLTLTDQTASSSWSAIFTYNSSLASAEWVEEAPYLGGILPLANYGTATFDPGTVNNNQNPGLTAAEGVIMINPNGQTSNPSSPDSDIDGFNTCWGSGTLTTCAAPHS